MFQVTPPEQSSSGEEIVLDFANDFRKYNKELIKKKESGSATSSKVPKTPGFDFPLYSPGSKPKGSKPLPARTAARSTVTNKSPSSSKSQRSGADTDKKKQVEQAIRWMHEIHAASPPSSSPSSSSVSNRVSQENLRATEGNNNNKVDNFTEANDNDYTTVYSDEEEEEEVDRKRRRRRKQVQSSRQGEYRPHSRNTQVQTDESRPPKGDYSELGDPGHRRVLRRPRPLPSVIRNSRVQNQRLLDEFLAQPRVLVVPVAKPNKHIPKINKQRVVHSYQLPKKHLPMIRESGNGNGSSNIRFAHGVQIHNYKDPEDEAYEDYSSTAEHVDENENGRKSTRIDFDKSEEKKGRKRIKRFPKSRSGSGILKRRIHTGRAGELESRDNLLRQLAAERARLSTATAIGRRRPGTPHLKTQIEWADNF